MDVPTGQSDTALLDALAQSDQSALGELYDRYGSLALGVALQIVHDRGTAEEVVQDAFVSVWRQARTYQPERGQPRTWLLSIVHHRAIDRLRRQQSRGQLEPLDFDVPAERGQGADVWREVWGKLERAEIAAALGELPPEQREAIELAFFGALTHVEVAERTAQPLGTVKGRMRLGLRRLRSVLRGYEERKGAGQTPGANG